MKKLTENWKIKKGNLKNKTFRESIDYAFSNEPENENNAQIHLKGIKKDCLSKSSFINLEVTSLRTPEENISKSPRRSNR